LGIIRTPMHHPASYTSLAAVQPIGRVGEISDVVDGILYLEAATFATGEILTSTAARSLDIDEHASHTRGEHRVSTTVAIGVATHHEECAWVLVMYPRRTSRRSVAMTSNCICPESSSTST